MGIPDLTKEIINLTPRFIRLPYKRISFDYDKEADVLYISLKRPQRATTSEMLKEGILIRYRGKEIVGLMVFDARGDRKYE